MTLEERVTKLEGQSEANTEAISELTAIAALLAENGSRQLAVLEGMAADLREVKADVKEMKEAQKGVHQVAEPDEPPFRLTLDDLNQINDQLSR